jgi:hypothetical protein
MLPPHLVNIKYRRGGGRDRRLNRRPWPIVNTTDYNFIKGRWNEAWLRNATQTGQVSNLGEENLAFMRHITASQL